MSPQITLIDMVQRSPLNINHRWPIAEGFYQPQYLFSRWKVKGLEVIYGNYQPVSTPCQTCWPKSNRHILALMRWQSIEQEHQWIIGSAMMKAISHIDCNTIIYWEFCPLVAVKVLLEKIIKIPFYLQNSPGFLAFGSVVKWYWSKSPLYTWN